MYKRLVLLIIALLIGPGCAVGSGEPSRADLEQGRLRWNETQPSHYSVQVTETCAGCVGWKIDTVVLDGKPRGVDVLHVSEDWEQMQADAHRWPRSVDALFERAEEIFATAGSAVEADGCASVARVALDKGTGIPVLLSDENACGGVTWTVDFQVVEREGDRPLVDDERLVEGATVRSLQELSQDLILAEHVAGAVFVFREGYFGVDGYERLEDVRVGNVCGLSSDWTSCERLIEQLAEDPATPPLFVQSCSWCPQTAVVMLVTDTDGGAPRVIATAQEALETVGEVDSAMELMLVVQRPIATEGRTSEGWVVVTSELMADCDPIITRRARQILSGASLVELDRWYSISWGVCH